MKLCLSLDEIQPRHAPMTGGKVLARLGAEQLCRPGRPVHPHRGLPPLRGQHPLGEKIRLELSRKEFRHMRWEEL